MTMRRILVLVVILAVAVWLVWQPFGRKVTNSNPTGTTIIAFGDSLTEGVGVARGMTYVDLLSERFGVEIVNAGVRGDTTRSAMARLDSDVLSRDPKVVILALGGNDLLQKIPLTDTERNLETMISRIHDKGAAVVLVGVDGPLASGGVGRVVKRLARKHRCAAVPNILSGLIGNPRMMTDPVHPNAEGHKVMAERLGKVLKRKLPSVFSERN